MSKPYSSSSGFPTSAVLCGTVLLCMFALLPSGQAALKLWTGNVNGSFTTSGNWSPSGAPAAGDDLIFQPNNLVARLLVTNDFSPNRAFASIAFQGSNYFLRGNPIILTNGFT